MLNNFVFMEIIIKIVFKFILFCSWVIWILMFGIFVEFNMEGLFMQKYNFYLVIFWNVWWLYVTFLYYILFKEYFFYYKFDD